VKQRRVAFTGAAAAAAASLVLVASGQADPARDRLRMIVQQQCLPLWLKEHRSDPCASVTAAADDPHAQAGYAILHDRKGGAHFLLIATRSIAGIESPELLEPGAPNYFDEAWQSREALAQYLGRPVPRSAVGLALNSRRARSQDQLHIHIACLGSGIFKALQENAEHIRPAWSQLVLDGQPYQVMRIRGAQLATHNPVQLLAASLPEDVMKAGQYTMLVAGMEYADGPGFAVLASATAAGAELLLDSRCQLASTVPAH
jgi:CDP-diacylglycerol pyrophosphatase